MNKLFKISMFITSFLPLWITIVFLDIMSIVKGNECLYTEIIGISVIAVMVFISSIIVYKTIGNLNSSRDYKSYKIVSVTQEKGVTSEFLLSYILPLFVFNFTEWEGVLQFLIYFLILTFLCVRNNNVYANLLLELKNYKFYSCELAWSSERSTSLIQAIVISDVNLSAYKGNTIEISPLNKPFYLNR